MNANYSWFGNLFDLYYDDFLFLNVLFILIELFFDVIDSLQ